MWHDLTHTSLWGHIEENSKHKTTNSIKQQKFLLFYKNNSNNSAMQFLQISDSSVSDILLTGVLLYKTSKARSRGNSIYTAYLLQCRAMWQPRQTGMGNMRFFPRKKNEALSPNYSQKKQWKIWYIFIFQEYNPSYHKV